MKHLTVVLGTAREGRESEKVAESVAAAFRSRPEFEVTYVDIRDHLTEPRTIRRKDTKGDVFAKWQQIAENTEVFILVIPEYHRGYPGEWKLFIDSLEHEYRDKPAYIVGVSSGIFAGVRMGEHVKPVLVELGFVLSRTALYVGNSESVLEKGGEQITGAFYDRLSKFVDNVTLRETAS